MIVFVDLVTTSLTTWVNVMVRYKLTKGVHMETFSGLQAL